MNNNQKPWKINRENKSVTVHSVFPTIQGEGPYAGNPCVFVRLAGCNLQCPFCDTEYTNGTKPLRVKDIISLVFEAFKQLAPSTNLVVITGGEPFRQSSLIELVSELLSCGLTVQIETNGTIYQELPFYGDLTIVCSPKTPRINSKLRRYIHHFKYVVKAGEVNEETGLPTKCLGMDSGTLYNCKEESIYRNPTIYIQPLDEQDPLLNKQNLDEAVKMSFKYGHTLCLQIHKIIGVM